MSGCHIFGEDLIINPLFAGGCRMTRPDSSIYVGDLQLGEVGANSTASAEQQIMTQKRRPDDRSGGLGNFVAMSYYYGSHSPSSHR
jgi:hypothetical protein